MGAFDPGPDGGGVVNKQTKKFAGIPENVGAARRFVTSVLDTAGFSDTETAALVASELVTNSIEHSLSAGPDGRVTVSVDVAFPSSVTITVQDDGPADGMAPLIPASTPPVDDESGRGLWLVESLADKFGYDGRGRYWARLTWGTGRPAPEAPAGDPGALFVFAGGAR